VVGFAHGAADAIGLAELLDMGRTGNRRAAVCLGDVVVADIDSAQAMRSWARIWPTVPDGRVLGVARTPRGWHVWLDLPGWSQGALNRAMTAWLDDWHGTDAAKISLRGYLLDLRTGPNRYVVWPGDWPDGSVGGDRRWVGLEELRDAVDRAGRGLRRAVWPVEDDGVVVDGAVGRGDGALLRVAPWNQPVGEDLTRWIAAHEGGWSAADVAEWGALLSGDRSAVADAAAAELDRWCARLAGMGPETGRNNLLNAAGFGPGARAVVSGAMTREDVVGRLEAAAVACGCPGMRATIASGLNSGVRSLTAGLVHA
jgi:hypothetical protein